MMEVSSNKHKMFRKQQREMFLILVVSWRSLVLIFRGTIDIKVDRESLTYGSFNSKIVSETIGDSDM
jgi:hypothetical protein